LRLRRRNSIQITNCKEVIRTSLYQREGELSKFHIERIAKGVFLTDDVNAKEVQKILHCKGTRKIKQYFLDVTKIVG
jgi:hypothetical protein